MKDPTEWLLPPDNLLLAKDEVHIWRGNLDLSESVIHQFTNVLSEDELDRANRFYFLKDKHRFISGRGMLRKILSFYLGVEPDEVPFQYSQYGKPYLSPEKVSSEFSIPAFEIAFNLSHSNSIALLGVTKSRRVGIDVEYAKHLPDADEIARRFFSPQENLIFQELTQKQKQTAFYHIWTRKEAFIKAIGEGLSYPLDQFDVSFLPEEQPCIKQISGDSNMGNRWSVKTLTPHPGYIGAIVVEGNSLSFFEYVFSPDTDN